MSSPLTPAAAYLVFGMFFIVVVYLLEIDVSSEIYYAAIKPFETVPFQLEPTKTFYQIQGPGDVFQWLELVFLNTVFASSPVIGGEGISFCNTRTKCDLGKGNAYSDNTCSNHLRAGNRNCAGFMGTGTSCCEPCQGSHCPEFTVTANRHNYVMTTSVDDVSANCDMELPSWLEDISQWIPEDRDADVNWGGVSDVSPVQAQATPVDFKFCPENVPMMDFSLRTNEVDYSSKRMATIAEFNAVLMARASMKRVKLRDSDSLSYWRGYHAHVSDRQIIADQFHQHAESVQSFGSSCEQCQYRHGAGYSRAGGFISFLNFNRLSQNDIRKRISFLHQNNWFDLNQGSFTLEMLLYNANVEKFLYAAFVFEHDFSGRTNKRVETSSLDISTHDRGPSELTALIILFALLVALFCYFVKKEFDEVSADYQIYFSNFLNWLNLVMLALCVVSATLYCSVVLSPISINVKFPLPESDEDQEEMFNDLVILSERSMTFLTFLSVNTCLIIVKFISQIFCLAPDSGIVFNTISQVKGHLVCVFAILSVLILGWTFSGYLCFGHTLKDFSSMSLAFNSTVRAIMFESFYSQMKEAAPLAGYWYFICFHTLFLVVRQPLLSIIIYGYKLEKTFINQLADSDRYPHSRAWRQWKAHIREQSSFINRGFVVFSQLFGMLFGSGDHGTNRIHYDKIATLRDGRATRPRVRHVQYVKNDLVGHVDVDKDITLRAANPFYRDGMMQYYVDEVVENGPAWDARVGRGFRLVGIQLRGNVDRLRFRDRKKFHSEDDFAKVGYNKDPQNVLKNLKDVTLVFEGGVKGYSITCISLVLYIIVFVVVGAFMARCHDSVQLQNLYEERMVKPVWYEANPGRYVTFKTMMTRKDLTQWMSKALLPATFQCVAELGKVCTPSHNLAGDFRDGWFLWSVTGAAGVREVMTKPGVTLPLSTRPKSAAGLSMGYVPLTGTARPSKKQVDISQAPLQAEHNVGIMPNNQIRITFQFSCFEEMPISRFKVSFPFRINNVMRRLVGGCSDSDCMKQMIERAKMPGQVCLDSHGTHRDPEKILGIGTGNIYEYVEKGSYRDQGGIVVGMGNSLAEAEEVVSLLNNDNIFGKDAASLVVEMVNYNGNLDMFALTTVRVDLPPTGMLMQTLSTKTFTLDIFSSGQSTLSRFGYLWVPIFLAAYVIFTLFFTGYLFYDLSVQYKIAKELQRSFVFVYFVYDFFMDDWWNCIDVASVVINYLALASLLDFAGVGGRLNIGFDKEHMLQSWTLTDYEFESTADLQSVDPFSQIERAAHSHDNFLGFMATNGLFMFSRLIRYFAASPELRLMMSAIAAAVVEFLIVSVINLLIFCSFALLFYMRIGIKFYRRFGTLLSACVELFKYIIGQHDFDDILEYRPSFMLPTFTIFRAVFLLLLNMYLAAIVYTWLDARRDAQPFGVAAWLRRIKRSLRRSSKREEASRPTMVALDPAFWGSCCILTHLRHIDQAGQIKRLDCDDVVTREAHPRPNNEEEHAEPQREDCLDWERDPEASKKLTTILKKAHMTIAETLSKRINVDETLDSRLVRLVKDSGAGVGGLEAEMHASASPGDIKQLLTMTPTDALATASPRIVGARSEPVVDQSKELQAEIDLDVDAEKFKYDETVGMSDRPVEARVANEIRRHLVTQLQQIQHPSFTMTEIWLDTLITLLDEQQVLERIRHLFMPPTIHMPRKQKEWAEFQHRRVTLERRLDGFLGWMYEETMLMHYNYLKDSAIAKERLLKQQSLVLVDYLDRLDGQIFKLKKSIKVLEERHSEIMKHVSILLTEGDSIGSRARDLE